MTNQIDKIKTKLSELKSQDTNFKIFGSIKHQYKLNETKNESELASFETKYGILLPLGYRQFLMNIGNGGAGPFYGLESIENALCVDLDKKDFNNQIDPGVDFPHIEAWNMEFEDDEEHASLIGRDKIYFDKKWITGVLRICNYGCGVFINMVVKGPEYGNIWVDERCNDGGIYPDQNFGNEHNIGFLDWYELWLDNSLIEISNQRKS